MTDPVTLINQRAAENYKRMTLKKYNTAEISQLEAVRDRLKWLLGEELGFDPQTDPKALQEVERRLAHWLLDEHGGEILRESVLNK
jgi:hypothetical protein